MADGNRLEKPPHTVGLGKAAGGFDQGGGPPGRLTAGQAIGALEEAKPREEKALRNGAMHGRSRLSCCLGEGLEIHMRREVGKAGTGKRVGRPT